MDRIYLTNAADLLRIGQEAGYPANGEYILVNDIAINGDWASLAPMTGIKLDGDGHRIGPLNMPLFWSLEDAKITNLTLDLAIATKNEPTPNNYGAVAGLTQSAYRTLVENCIAYGSVEGHFAVSGLCGNLNDCDMIGCVNYAALRVESSEAGGIAAFANNTNFFHCRNHGPISSADSETRFGLGDIGGIVGTMWATWDLLETTYAIVDCFNDGEIISYRTGGGIVGFLRGGDRIGLEVLRCVNRGRVRGSLRAHEDPLGGVLFGGIAGQGVSFVRIQDCLNSGDISGCGSIGGIIGEARHPKWGWHNVSDLPPPSGSNRIDRCENQGSITLYKPLLKGHDGYEVHDGQEAHEKSQDDVSEIAAKLSVADSEGAPCKAGGIAGALLFIGGISGCENHGAVKSEGAFTGGIVGLVRTGAVDKCENKAPVNSVGVCCGGIAGCIDRVLDQDTYPMPQARNQSIVESCVNRGPIRAQGCGVGGVAGALLNGSDAIECRNCAEIIGLRSFAGGIVGCCAIRDTISCNHVEQNLQSGPSVVGRAHVHRILGGREDAASVSLENNEAAQDTMLTGDNTTDSGIIYEAQIVRLDDPLLSPDGLQGDTVVCGRSKRLSSCDGCVTDEGEGQCPHPKDQTV